MPPQINDGLVARLIEQHPEASNVKIAELMFCTEGAIRRSRKRLARQAADEAEVQWGQGAAAPVAPLGNKDGETVAFLSDQHFPHEDKGVIASALNFLRRIQPDRVVLNGDLMDAHQLSRFFDGVTRVGEVQNDLDRANAFLAKLHQAVPNAAVEFVIGNHDQRWIAGLQKLAPQLLSLRGLQLDGLLDLTKNDIRMHAGNGFLLRRDFLVYHGERVSSISGGTARAELARNGVSGTSGHVHRAEQATRHGYDRAQWTVTGTMSRLNPDYINGRPAWDQGIAFGEFLRSGNFAMHSIPFVDGALRFGRDTY